MTHGPDGGPDGRGFSLLEVVIALLLFQVGVLAVAGMILMAQENVRRSEWIMRGTLEAVRIGDSLFGKGIQGGGELEKEWGRMVWAPGPSRPGELNVWAVAPEGTDTLAFLKLWALPGGEGEVLSCDPGQEGCLPLPLPVEER